MPDVLQAYYWRTILLQHRLFVQGVDSAHTQWGDNTGSLNFTVVIYIRLRAYSGSRMLTITEMDKARPVSDRKRMYI